MTVASTSGLGFILFQRDSTGKQSILKFGSTCLKNAQIRWHPTELELLAIQYCLTKCHFYTAWSDKPVTIYSDCAGLRNFEAQEISSMHSRRMLEMKVNMQMYNYTVKIIKGKKNEIAEMLSRRPTWLVDK